MSTPSFQRVTPRNEDDDDVSPEEILAKKRKRRWMIAMGIVIVIGAVVGLNARSISRNIKSWQAERAAKESARFLAVGDYKEAQAKVQDALALSPTNSAGMLAAARFLSTVGNHRDAVSFWKKLEENATFTAEDHRQYAISLLGIGDVLQASTHLQMAWPKDQPGTPADWIIALPLAMQRRDETTAISLAQKLMNSSAASADQRLKAATLMTSAPQPEQRAEAWKLIETLSQDPNSTGLEALVTLARRVAAAQANKNSTEDLSSMMSPKSIADAIDANPKAETKHHLFAMDLRLIAEPLRKPEMIQLAEEKYSGNDDDLEALASWLYGKGEFQKILTHLPTEVAAHRRSLFLQSLDALAAMGRWKDVAAAINGASFSLDRVTAEMYLARCSKEMGEKAGANNHWQAALDAANGNSQQLVLVADYAERAGNIDIAKTGFLAATEARNDFLPAFQRLLLIAQSQRDTVTVNDALKRMSVQWPDEAAVRNDLAYTDLLLKKDEATATTTAESLFAKEPASLPHRITLALARIRAGKPADAASVLDNLTGNLGPLEARKRAIQAAALWANDQKTEAAVILQGVKLDQLFPEEQALVADIPQS